MSKTNKLPPVTPGEMLLEELLNLLGLLWRPLAWQ